jgi:hypothetical protein
MKIAALRKRAGMLKLNKDFSALGMHGICGATPCRRLNIVNDAGPIFIGPGALAIYQGMKMTWAGNGSGRGYVG